MKQLYFFICIGILSTINGIDASDNDVDLYKEKNRCVKVYYVDDGFYNVNCFANLSNNDYGIVTNKNDTIVVSDAQKNRQCFKITSGQHSGTSVACVQEVDKNCIETRAKIKDVTKINEIPCKIQVDRRELGLSFEKMHVIFRCNISFEKTQVIGSKERFTVKYCKSPRSNKNRMEDFDDPHTHGFIAYVPDLYPKREK
ncbi:uncharacterized protein LOC114349487 isoform X2 [Diabrotica virgifera virgifera]|uniref:Uncharacterized protein n=1 Tax=Diabrotica virgifera virgifera TaxID=50390 RepID=A0ABM5J0K5_DIAVI|nr:uncharacterized protein LOC114349487 isoform X2 [Diabrotica virgifera virgifera]